MVGFIALVMLVFVVVLYMAAFGEPCVCRLSPDTYQKNVETPSFGMTLILLFSLLGGLWLEIWFLKRNSWNIVGGLSIFAFGFAIVVTLVLINYGSTTL